MYSINPPVPLAAPIRLGPLLTSSSYNAPSSIPPTTKLPKLTTSSASSSSTDSESRPRADPQDARVRTRDGQHPRRRPGAVAAPLCVLDPRTAPRRARNREGPLGRGRGIEGIGGVGEEGRATRELRQQPPQRERGCGAQRRKEGHTGAASLGKDAQERMTTAPNGWLFWPDASGLTSNEVTLRAELGWTEQIYDRVSSSGELEVLGEGVELSPDDSNDSPRCFNCGSTSHMMTSCPAPRNQALISLSRSLYQFYRHGAVSEPPRLHVAEEWKLARLRWLDEFVPGEVKSTRLREALSLKEGDPGENAPWLHNMLVWGYPPGWAGVDDPKRAVLERVISTGDEGFQDDESDVFAIFSNGTDAELLRLREPLKETEHEADEPLVSSNQGNQHKTGDKSHRWAIYQTTLFSSELLPVYTGRPLPALHNDCDESATVYRALMSSAKQTNASHPWRHPDAFSASGSVDWSELYQEGPTSTEAPTGEFSFDPGADSEEMDCSD